MVDYFKHSERIKHQRQAEFDGRVSDSIEVRIALLHRMHKGELTLEQVKSELAKLQRSAKGNGQITRSQAYRGY